MKTFFSKAAQPMTHALKCNRLFVLVLCREEWVSFCPLIYPLSGSGCQGESFFCRMIYIFYRSFDLSSWLSGSDTNYRWWSVEKHRIFCPLPSAVRGTYWDWEHNMGKYTNDIRKKLKLCANWMFDLNKFVFENPRRMSKWITVQWNCLY